ncbi:Uncharacterized protein FKW44_009063, partial [Caligus rogercresseyi]
HSHSPTYPTSPAKETDDPPTTDVTATTPLPTDLVEEEDRKAKDIEYPSGIVSQIEDSSNWPWGQEEPDVHTLTTTADLSGKWFRRPSEGGLRSPKEFEDLTSFLNSNTSVDQDSVKEERRPPKKTEEDTTFRPDKLVIFYPLNGKPFLSFVPKVEYADITSTT